MENFLNFVLYDPSSRLVILGVALLCISTSLLGSFAFLQKKSLVGDVISHAALPGICLSYMLLNSKSPYVLALGALVSGLFSQHLIKLITKHSKIKEDAALAIVLSTMFGLGIVLLTRIQQSGNASQAGLSNFLLGKVASMTDSDCLAISIVCGVSILLTLIFFKEFQIVSFDIKYAKIIGINVSLIDSILSCAIVTAIVIGVKIVGVLLMSAMLITPVAAARYWTNSLQRLLILAVIISIISGFWGAYISYMLPSMSTGPWIVVFLTFFAYFSFLFSYKNGYLKKIILNRQHRSKVMKENILKYFYESCSISAKDDLQIDYNTILKNNPMPSNKLKTVLNILCQSNLLKNNNEWYALTKLGHKEGKRVHELHILWELYLQNYLKIKSDHVHDDAESIEHIITPEIEEDLRKIMKQ